MKFFITGGAGFIGSHTVLQLLENGHDVTVFDNLSNGSEQALARVAELAGREAHFVHGDLRDEAALRKALIGAGYDSVVHFAGLKAVGESVLQPVSYYENNVVGTLNLIKVMEVASLRRLVFSSSATVYGAAGGEAIPESAPRSATNPYGRSKLMVEQMLEDMCRSDSRWSVVNLRYFNPVGAHPSGRVGEDPAGVPNNLMPFITQVACGRREILSVYGADYPTDDGTGVRDYIHVDDLARGHLAALDYIAGSEGLGALAVNLGTGRGISVLELVETFKAVNGVGVPFQVVGRRDGDVASCYADTTLARRLLGWTARLGVEDMCKDAWCWQQQNPRGYDTV